VAVNFLPALVEAVKVAEDAALRFQLLRAFCELALNFLAQDDTGLVVQLIIERFAPSLDAKFLRDLEEPLPSLLLQVVLAASSSSRLVLNALPASALVDFCLQRPTSPQAWEVLAVLASGRLFDPLESPAALGAIRIAIAAASSGEREEATGEAAAQLLADALSAASPAAVAHKTAVLALLVGPCALAAGFRWAAELLAALAFALPSGSLALTTGDAASLAAALGRSGGDWARASALIEVCGRVGSSSDSKILARGLADFLLKFRDEAPAATVAAARKVFKILN